MEEYTIHRSLGVQVQHARLEKFVHHNLSQHFGLSKTLRDSIVSVFNAKKVAISSPESDKILQFLL